MVDAKYTYEEIKEMAKDFLKDTFHKQLEKLKEYSNSSLEMALMLSISVVELIKDINLSQKELQFEYMEMCNKAIEAFKKDLDTKELSKEERIAIYDHMEEILRMYHESEEKNRRSATIEKIALWAIGGLTIGVSAVALLSNRNRNMNV